MCVIFPFCSIPKRIIELERATTLLDDRLQLCEKSIKINEAMIKHYESRLEWMEKEKKMKMFILMIL